MAKLIRNLRRTHQSLSNFNFFNPTNQNPSPFTSKLHPLLPVSCRSYCVSEMRKNAFEDNILRLIRREIQYELHKSSPKQPVTQINSFTIDEQPGQQWIRLKRRFGENEEVKVEATMLYGSDSDSKDNDPSKEVILHISLIVNIQKDDGEVLEFICSAWPNSLEIVNVFVRTNEAKPSKPYLGPEFEELDDELQDSLYDFLEDRGIDDNLAEFLHKYMENKDKSELIRWMERLKSYIEEK